MAKPSLMQGMVLLVVLLLAATVYRVATAPERRQIRLETARQTCTSQGGEWVRIGRDDHCVMPAERKKP